MAPAPGLRPVGCDEARAASHERRGDVARVVVKAPREPDHDGGRRRRGLSDARGRECLVEPILADDVGEIRRREQRARGLRRRGDLVGSRLDADRGESIEQLDDGGCGVVGAEQDGDLAATQLGDAFDGTGKDRAGEPDDPVEVDHAGARRVEGHAR